MALGLDFGAGMIARKLGIGEPMEAESGGKVASWARFGAFGFGLAFSPSLQRIGEARGGRFSLCAFPTTAFSEIFSRRPTSAVESPTAQSVRNFAIASSVHSML